MAMSWYAVNTYAGQEDKIKVNIERRVGSRGLQGRIGRIVIPTEKVPSMVAGKKRMVTKKILPGYILMEMEMDDETWHFVTETVGVTNFLGQPPGSTIKPPPLQPSEIAVFVGGEEAEPLVAAPKMYAKGEMVNVIGGPFAGSEGRVEDIHLKTEKVTVSIPLFGRETKVDLEFGHVERVT